MLIDRRVRVEPGIMLVRTGAALSDIVHSGAARADDAAAPPRNIGDDWSIAPPQGIRH